MGTNYYLTERPPCAHCGRGDEPLHIGKSSAGWVFALRIHPGLGIHDLPDWIARWSARGAAIRDEYGHPVTPHEMHRIITARGRPDGDAVWDRQPFGYASWDAFHAQNHSERGPNGLIRSQRSHLCRGPGAGTWDLLEGDFS